MSLSVVVKNSCETTGEGPHWDPETQCLYYVDILAGDVHRWNSVTGEDQKVHLADGPVSFVIPRDQGGLVIGYGRTVSILDFDSGAITKIVEVDQGTNNRFNDGKCDSIGRLWAGTMGHEPLPTKVEREMGSLFSMEKDHTLRTHVSKINISNGLAWSHDLRTMYYIDSLPRCVYAFDYDKDTGTLSNQRTFIEFGEGTVDTLGFPDGMCTDTDGDLWIACYGVGKVIKFDKNTGEQLRTISFPVKRTTSCSFGGKNFDELYVTSGKFGLTEEEFKNEQPLAGSVFKVTELGVKGMPATKFSG